MEKVDSTTIYSEPWVELYKDCFRNSQNMVKKNCINKFFFLEKKNSYPVQKENGDC